MDKLGLASEQIEETNSLANVRSLVALLKQRGGVWEEVFGNAALRITVNKQFSDLDTPLKDEDAVAFISAWL